MDALEGPVPALVAEEIGDGELEAVGRLPARASADGFAHLFRLAGAAHGGAHAVAAPEQSLDHPARQVARSARDEHRLTAVAAPHVHLHNH